MASATPIPNGNPDKLEYKPDIVTLCVGANDSSNNSEIHITLTDREYWEYLQAKKNKPLRTTEVVLNKLRSYLINSRVYNAMNNILFQIRNKPKRRVPIEDLKKNIDEIIGLSRLYNFKVLFITEAHRNPHAILEYIDVLKKTSANNENVFFVDNRPFLEDDSYFVDEMHPTYEGHEIIAKVVFDSILGIKLTD